MATVINPDVSVFLGLNNALNPCSHEYREGMAYVSDNSRIDESGRWSEQAKLSDCSSAPVAVVNPKAGASGPHVKNLSIDGTDSVVTTLATGDVADVGSNRKLYTLGSGNVYNADGLVIELMPPAMDDIDIPEKEAEGIGFRGIAGTYFYVFTTFDTTYKRESLPTLAFPVTILEIATDRVKLTIPKPASGYEVRIYRTRMSNSALNVYSAPNIFYYVDRIPYQNRGAATTVVYYDYHADEELALYEYEARGTPPPSDIDYMASYNNRMLYFQGSRLWWSSAGRPEEVAQEYYLTYYESTVFELGGQGYCADFDTSGGGTAVEVTTSANHGMANDGGAGGDGKYEIVISRSQYFNGKYFATWTSANTFTIPLTWPDPNGDDSTYSVAAIWSLDDYVVSNLPRLASFVYAESFYDITELEGKTVQGTFVKDGRLWLGTTGMLGYLEADRKFEGYRFRTVREGIGLINDKVIAHTLYGVFAADRRGIWQLMNDGKIKRLSDGVIDISSSGGKSTSLSQTYVADSFGVWLPTLEEYWWSIQKGSSNITGGGSIDGDGDDVLVTTAAAHGLSVGDVIRITGTTNYDVSDAVVHTVANTTTFEYDSTVNEASEATGVVEWFAQIVYQANRGIFVGPYSHTIDGGTNFVSAGGAQAYLSTGIDDLEGSAAAENPKDGLPNTAPLVLQGLRFWMGQANLVMVKSEVKMEVVYSSITADKSITVTSYQNNIASTTGAYEYTGQTHSAADNLVGRVEPGSSGRMFMVKLEIPRDCTAPILALNYKATIVPWSEKAYR